MIESTYKHFLELTGGPTAAALLTLAEALTQPEKAALTAKEAAKAIGVSVDAIYDLCKSGKLRHQRLGPRTIRIRPEDLANLKEDTAQGSELRRRMLGL